MNSLRKRLVTDLSSLVRMNHLCQLLLRCSTSVTLCTRNRPKQRVPAERIAAITPLRAKFLSEDGKEQLTVIQRNGSELKQFLFQARPGRCTVGISSTVGISAPVAAQCILPGAANKSAALGPASITELRFRKSKLLPPAQVQDIRQFGSLEEVAALLLPKEVQVLAQGSSTVEQEPRDTGTVLGVVQLPPQTFYRCPLRPLPLTRTRTCRTVWVTCQRIAACSAVEFQSQN